MDNNDDEVGYKKPPKNHQFKKGQSGNPKGRPKRSQNKTPYQILEQALTREITIKENGQAQKVTIQEAILKKLSAEALKGEPYAIREMLKLLKEYTATYASIHEREEDNLSVVVQFLDSNGDEIHDLGTEDR